MEKKLFSNAVFGPAIICRPFGLATDGNKRYEVVFRLAAIWMDGVIG